MSLPKYVLGLALLVTASIGAWSIHASATASSSSTAVQSGPTHEVQISVLTTGSPWAPTHWSGGTQHLYIDFYQGFVCNFNEYTRLSLQLSPGPSACGLATQIADAINADWCLRECGYEARVVDNQVFVSGPWCKYCSGTIDAPVLCGSENKVQLRTHVHKL